MSNCETIDLPQLDLEPYQVTEVLRCLLHTILFNRALGTVTPREVDAELFEITWVQCGDNSVDTKVDSKVSQVQSWADRNPGRRLQVCLSFYELRQQQSWFGRQEQRLKWEEWKITLGVLPSDAALSELNALEADSARAAQKFTLQSALEDCITRIVTTVNEKRNHIPPVVSDAAITFPFDISLSGPQAATIRAALKRVAMAGMTNSRGHYFATESTSASLVVADICRAHRQTDALEAAASELRANVRPGRALADFTRIETLQGRLLEKFSVEVAEAATELKLNRYIDVLPYDHCRIVLAQPPPEDPRLLKDTIATDYINASLLRNTDPCARVQWQYIAAQGPLPHTCAAFWQMIVEQGVRAVVMLTGLVEGRRRKCEAYFPQGPEGKVRFGSITVQGCGAEEIAPGVIQRRLHVTGVLGSERISKEGWEIDHFHFTSWPDHGVPSSPQPLLALCAALRAAPSGDFSSPVLVHCSAGIGRSGVFCVVDMAARQLTASGDNIDATCAAVDVASMVALLRHQRAGMVQTPGQYEFCSKALLALVEQAIEEIHERNNPSKATVE